MSKHNYSQYSKKNDGKSGVVGANVPNSNKNNKPKQPNSNYIPPATVPKAADEVKMERIEPIIDPVIKPVQEAVTTVTLPETVTGTVTNCVKLNVRANPSMDANVVYVLDAAAEIQIDAANSNNEWLKVCTATGIEGYCMRKFVDARL